MLEGGGGAVTSRGRDILVHDQSGGEHMEAAVAGKVMSVCCGEGGGGGGRERRG